MTEVTIEKLTQAFVKTRALKDEIKARHKEELAPVIEQENLLEGKLAYLMQEQGLQSAPNQYGTPYKSATNSFPVTDWDTFFNFASENGLSHMIERRASKGSVEEYLEGQGELPPGLSMKSVVRIRVRSKQ